jgi:hypothetical protein
MGPIAKGTARGRPAARTRRETGAARNPDPAAIPHRQLIRVPFRIPADTGNPPARGICRQCPE